MVYTAAVIGTGPDPENPSDEGYAMGYRHADAYEALDGVDLVACADIVPENAGAFARSYGLNDDHIFEQYDEMVAAVEPDVVSVTVPPAIHEDITVDCVRSGVVSAVHCEPDVQPPAPVRPAVPPRQGTARRRRGRRPPAGGVLRARRLRLR